MKKDYRRFYRIFLVLFLLSFGANLFAVAFYFKERLREPSVLREREESKEVQRVETTENTVPVPIVHVKNKEYFLLCEKNSKTLNLYRSEQNTFHLIKSYPCIVGSNNGDKREAGDRATPKGIYFLVSFLTGESLLEKYGSGAFSLNYPNFLDQREGKKGSGIWLHGSPDHTERPLFSEGCVVVRNEVLNELIGFIETGDTPLVIVDTIKYQPRESQLALLQTLSDFLIEWERAWEGRDTETYLSFYGRDFVSSDGKDYQRFKAYKYRVNRSKKFIKLEIEPKGFFL